jgi:hypothetical protein
LRHLQPFSSPRIAVLALFSFSLMAPAAVVYNESVQGDLSNNGLAPTAIAFAAGSNQIFGTTGRGMALDRDYFTFTVPTGMQLSSLTVLPGTTVGGAVSFIGLEAGPQVTVATSAATAAGLLGWWHYAPGDGNILPNMAAPNTGSSGFAALGSGAYSIWIQDFNAGTFNYGFDFALTPTPEPGSLCALGLVFLAGLTARRRILRSDDAKCKALSGTGD